MVRLDGWIDYGWASFTLALKILAKGTYMNLYTHGKSWEKATSLILSNKFTFLA
jgi:hypothetical protein